MKYLPPQDKSNKIFFVYPDPGFPPENLEKWEKFFQSGNFKILPESQGILDQLRKIMEENNKYFTRQV